MLKGLKRRFFLMILCFFVGAWSGSEICVGAETAPQMTASLVPNQTSVGGIITLTLKLQLPTGARLAPEPVVKGLAGFRILDQQMIPDDTQKKTDGKKSPDTVVSGEYHIRLMVNRLDSGAVGPIFLSYVNADGEKASLKAATVPLTVLSNLGEKPEAARLKPIYGIIPTQSFMAKYRFWILGGIAVLLLGAAIEWWFRNRRQKDSSALERTPPDKLAMRGLKALDAQRLFEEGRIKDFYFEFSEILRRYLEAIRGFPAAEYTLEEIARAARKKEDQPLLSLLRRTDMVKFADSTATLARKTDDMEGAFAYIRSTRDPVMSEASSEHSGGKQYAVRSFSSHRKERAPS
ncbi:MAG: hypothetical protein LJE96_04295 [Deltaproteobacteria bacterium]|nr:hypothetical protein [Deltaproteobacteria bacterium]